MPRAASTVPLLLDRVGTACPGSPGIPPRGGSPAFKSLLLPTVAAVAGLLQPFSQERKGIIISLKVSQLLPILGPLPFTLCPTVGDNRAGGLSHVPWSPRAMSAMPLPTGNPAAVTYLKQMQKAEWAGRTTYHRSNGGSTKHHSWPVLAAPSCFIYSQCHEGHPELCLARRKPPWSPGHHCGVQAWVP